MRLGGRAADIVFGDDGARRFAGRPRQRLERIGPFVDRAQIDGGEVLGHLAVLLRRAGARVVEHRLRLDRLAHRAIAHHAGDDLHPLVDVMGRLRDAFEGVAAGAVEQHCLLLFGAGDAHHPFGIGELVGEIFGLVQLEIDIGGLLADDVGRGRRGEVVADGADGERVVAGLEAVFRKGVMALGVGGDADRDDRPVLVGGDDDAFHGAFGLGGDLAGERRRRLVGTPACRDRQHHASAVMPRT